MMESTINFIIILFINLFDIYILYRYMTIFFGEHTIDNKIIMITYSFRWLIGTALNEILPYPIITISFWFISTFIIALCYSAKLSKKILVTLIIYLCCTMSELIMAIIIQATNFGFFKKAEYGNIITYIIIKLIYWMVSLIIQRLKGINLNVKLPKIFIVAVIIVPVSSIIVIFVIFSQSTFNKYLTSLSLFCFIASTFITIYLFDSYSKIFNEQAQAELSKRERTYYKKQTEALQKNQEELRQFRHDIQNRMISIRQMLEKKEYQQALDYTNQISQRLDNMIYYSETGNIAIDSIINYKLTNAARKDIEVIADISIPEKININDDDIIVIIGNLLDNSIEANDRITENKYINFTMKYIAGCLYIQTKNSYDSIVLNYNGNLKSRKGDEVMHGIGIKSIQSIADNYNGTLKFSYDKKEFQVLVMLCDLKPIT